MDDYGIMDYCWIMELFGITEMLHGMNWNELARGATFFNVRCALCAEQVVRPLSWGLGASLAIGGICWALEMGMFLASCGFHVVHFS